MPPVLRPNPRTVPTLSAIRCRRAAACVWGRPASQRLLGVAHATPSRRQGRAVSTAEEVRWADVESGRVTKAWPLPKAQVFCGFSPDGPLAMLTDKAALHLWDLTTRKELRTLNVNENQLRGSTDAFFTPDGKIAATLHGVNFNPGLVLVWDLDTGQKLWQEGVMGFYDQGLAAWFPAHGRDARSSG